MLHTNKFVKLEKTTYQRRLRTCEGPESVLDAEQELLQETAARRFHSSPPGALAAWPKPPWCRRLQFTSTGFTKGRRLNVLHRLALSYKEQTPGSITFRTVLKDRSVLHIFVCDPGSTELYCCFKTDNHCYIWVLSLSLCFSHFNWSPILSFSLGTVRGRTAGRGGHVTVCTTSFHPGTLQCIF